MSVETGSQSLLIEVMGNETDGTTQDEETVEDTHLKVIFGFFLSEGTTVSDEIDKAHGNTTINVQDKVVLLACGDTLDGKGVVEELVVGEALQHKLLDQLDTEIWVVAGLDLVTNTGN